MCVLSAQLMPNGCFPSLDVAFNQFEHDMPNTHRSSEGSIPFGWAQRAQRVQGMNSALLPLMTPMRIAEDGCATAWPTHPLTFSSICTVYSIFL